MGSSIMGNLYHTLWHHVKVSLNITKNIQPKSKKHIRNTHTHNICYEQIRCLLHGPIMVLNDAQVRIGGRT